VLLDTHVWLWAAEGGAKLGVKTRRRLERASASLPGELMVSVISAFEIAALHTAGHLRLNQSVDRWIRDTIDRASLRVIDLERDIAVDAGLIPTTALPDPFDRCLVATAREYGVPLVTRDRRILDYAKRTGLVKVIDASV
jgi:PIN domain nuclease of toxin-antitoxin system